MRGESVFFSQMLLRSFVRFADFLVKRKNQDKLVRDDELISREASFYPFDALQASGERAGKKRLLGQNHGN